MPYVTTINNYCFVQCDRTGCNRKMENSDQKVLKELALICGWENKGGEWICPQCVREIRMSKHLGKRSRRVRRAA